MRILLLGIFTAIGVFLVGLGIWIMRRPYGKHGVEVEAECVDIEVSDYKTSIDAADRTYIPNTKRPVYRYWYEGQYYIGQPLLQSNRPGYQPQLGKCMIRINPDHPERVYSSERKVSSFILIGIGVAYLIMVLLMYFFLSSVGVY